MRANRIIGNLAVPFGRVFTRLSFVIVVSCGLGLAPAPPFLPSAQAAKVTKKTHAVKKTKKKSGAKGVSGKAVYHKVRKGDTLWEIGRRYGVKVPALIRLNGAKARKLHPGMSLLVKPAKKPSGKIAKKNAGLGKTAKAKTIKSEGRASAVSDKVGDVSGTVDVASEDTPEPAEDTSKTSARDVDVDEPNAGDDVDEPNAGDDEAEAGTGADADEVDAGSSDADVADADEVDAGSSDADVADADEVGQDGAAEVAGAGNRLEPPISRVDVSGKYGKKAKSGGGDLYHKVKRGDSLWRISRKYNVPIKTIQKLNGKKAKRLRPGMHLLIRILDFETARKYRPFLEDWAYLEKGEGYVVKRPARAYGRTWAVTAIWAAIADWRAKHPESAPVVVGDISGAVGGYLPRHLSHQTGRDVDLGYFFNDQKQRVYFEKVNPETIDVERSWDLILTFLKTGQVELIFIDWRLQPLFYERAQAEGMSAEELESLFQYPAGKGARKGIIRHSKGHLDHLHLRFACPENDKLCK